MPGTNELIKRIELMQDHPSTSWMTVQAMSALAQSGMSNDELLHAGELSRQATVDANRAAGHSDAYTVFFHDPVLQKHPTAALAIRDFLTGTMGAQSVMEQHVSATQANLRAQGFGKDLDPNGVWTADWSNAAREQQQHLQQTQLSGHKDGGFSIGDVLDGAASLLNPVSAADHLLGFVKGLPNDLRVMAGDVAGGVAGGVEGAVKGLNSPDYTGFVNEVARGSMEGSSDVQNALGGNTTKEGVAESYGAGGLFDSRYAPGAKAQGIDTVRTLGHAAGDVGTAFLVADGLGGAAKGASLGYEKAFGEAATQAAAEQGGGVVATTLRDKLSAATDVTSPAYRGPGVIAKPAQWGLEKLGTAVEHVPGLGKVGPWVDGLADADGLYYRARRVLAIPYQFKTVATAGQALQDATVAGAKVGAAAELSPGSSMSQSVLKEHTLGDWNESLKKAAGPWGAVADANNLAFLAHGNLHGPSSSKQLAADAGSAVTAVNHSLGDLGWTGHFVRATGVSQSKWEKALGGPERFQKYLLEQVHQHSAWYGAEKQLAEEKLAEAGVGGLQTATDPALIDEAGKAVNERVLGYNRTDITKLQQYAHEIRNDPSLLKQAETGLLNDRGGQGFELRIARDVTNSRAAAHARGDEWIPGDVVNAGNYMDASEHINKTILPHLPPPRTEDEITGLTAARVKGGFKNPPAVGTQLGIQRLGTLDKPELKRAAIDMTTEWNDNKGAEQAYHDAVAAAHDAAGGAADEATLAGIDEKFPRPDPHWHQDWTQRANDLAFKVGADARHMAEDGPELMDALRSHADALLPTAVKLADDAPQVLKNAVAKLEADHGYRLVAGTDIGHMHAGDSAVTDLDGTYSWRRKLADKTGTSVERIDPADRAALVQQKLLMRLYDLADSGKLVLPQYTRPETIMAMLKEDDWLPKNMPFKGSVQLALTRAPQSFDKVKDPDIVTLAKTFLANNADFNEHTAIIAAQRQQALLATRPLQFRDISWRDFWDTFGNPRKFEERLPVAHEATADAENLSGVDRLNRPYLDKQSAMHVYKAMQKAYSDVPARMTGWSHVEDLFRASYGFAGTGIMGHEAIGRTVGGAGIGALAGAASDPGKLFDGDLSNVEKGAIGGAVVGGAFKNLGWVMANLPNNLIKMRNDLRFDLSPEFSIRRMTKANVKLAATEVPPTLNPTKWLRENGVLAEARDVAARVDPEGMGKLRTFDEAGDEAQRYLKAQDVFHLYNARDMQAYAAYHWAQQGKSDGEIHDLLLKAFDYAGRNAAGEMQRGRSALEQSANFVFFPFSFDKSLYTLLGSHLIDHAAQRIVLTHALAAYHTFSKEYPNIPGGQDWVDKHLPLMQEVGRLNAFSHGVGLGQPGGINAPLLQAFLPQSWSPSQQSTGNLERFIPALKDLGRIVNGANGQAGLLSQQADIISNEAKNISNSLRTTVGKLGKPFEPGGLTKTTPAETPQAQLDDAFARQRKITDLWGPVLRANQGRARADQIRFPINTKEWYAKWKIDYSYMGEPVTKASINTMLAEDYPAFHSEKGAQIAVANHEEWNRYIRTLQTTQPDQSVVEDHVALASMTDQLKSDIENSRFLKPGDTNYHSPEELRARQDSLRGYAIDYARRDPAFYKLYDKLFARTLGPLERVTS